MVSRVLSRIVLAVATILVGLPVGSASASPPPTLTWTACPDHPDVQCASLPVPIDWERPRGPMTDVALARRSATDPTARIGTLLFNLGGPGNSGVADLYNGYFGDEIRRRFDIVGFDPRGIGRSHPVRCSGDLREREPFPVPKNQAEFDQTLAYNRELRADCRARTGPLFDHVDSLSVVHDLDAIRAALGEEKISFYGLSYGTIMGLQYAERYPHRLRALALDSVLDHSLDIRGLLDTAAVNAQALFDKFVTWCDSETSCVLHGRDVRALLADLVGRAGRGELPYPIERPTPLRPEELIAVTANASGAGPQGWPILAESLLALENGTPLPNLPDPPPDLPEVVNHPWRAIVCADWTLPLRDHTGLSRHLRRTARLAPDLRYSVPRVMFATRCLGEPSHINNPQHRLQVRGTPPILLVHGLHDANTGYNMATRVAAQLGSTARLLTYDGWGHGVYPRSTCAATATDNYLLTLALPTPDTHCPA